MLLLFGALLAGGAAMLAFENLSGKRTLEKERGEVAKKNLEAEKQKRAADHEQKLRSIVREETVKAKT